MNSFNTLATLSHPSPHLDNTASSFPLFTSLITTYDQELLLSLLHSSSSSSSSFLSLILTPPSHPSLSFPLSLASLPSPPPLTATPPITHIWQTSHQLRFGGSSYPPNRCCQPGEVPFPPLLIVTGKKKKTLYEGKKKGKGCYNNVPASNMKH